MAKKERKTNKNRLENSEKGPLHLVLGVTGHRDIRPEDTRKLEATFRKSIRDLQDSYPSTPLSLITALADGADRLAAHVAIEMGIRLIVPLPLPRDEYERDF